MTWTLSGWIVAGPQLKALQIATDDFRPQGAGRSNPQMRWTFIHFTPKEEERRGLAPAAADVGASYAVDDQGVILKRE